MRNLRIIRHFVMLLFFGAAAGYVILGLTHNPMLEATQLSQIAPSLLTLTLGASLFWIAVTFFLGRIYCSSVCPIGAIQDGFLGLRKRFRKGKYRKKFSYKPPHNKIRYGILAAYVVCLVAGIGIVTALTEPWNIFCNIARAINPSSPEAGQLATLGVGTGLGFVAGIVSLLIIAIWALLSGRDFCNVFCPIGSALSLIDRATMYQIRIDPDKCINCMACEEVCKASCIKVAQRHVDNSRCIRCFNCLEVCPNDAIRLQSGRNRAATPLMRQV